ncbi:MAG: nitrite/sulfite reductase, partial [Planctomycetota bacterium]
MSKTWKERIGDAIASELNAEIDVFEQQIALQKAGNMNDKVFAETRLRRGAYGQRYDNGQRHDGSEVKQLDFGDVMKGPGTYWEAPGMIRIKIP